MSILNSVLSLGGSNLLGKMGKSFDPSTYQASTMTPEQQAQMKSMLGILSGNVAKGPQMDTNAVNNYYENAIANPATRNYELNTRPSYISKVGNMHSSALANQEQKGYENLGSNLQAQRADLMWNEKKNAQDQYNKSIQAMLAALGINSVENIVNQPGTIGGILKGVGGM